jgi:hypothetical protein
VSTKVPTELLNKPFVVELIGVTGRPTSIILRCDFLEFRKSMTIAHGKTWSALWSYKRWLVNISIQLSKIYLLRRVTADNSSDFGY